LNTVRGLLREFGVTIPVGAAHVVPQVRAFLAQPATPIPLLLHTTLTNACEEIRDLEAKIHGVDRQLTVLAQQMADVTLLQTVPGVGLVTATALVALIGDIRRFPSGRHFASYLGLTPREDSTALHRRLGAISKQGDVYLRMLLIHGARSLLCHAKPCTNPSALQHWALQTQQRRGHNIAAVAVANKLARIVWAVWGQQRSFATPPPSA
jgi:transposase